MTHRSSRLLAALAGTAALTVGAPAAASAATVTLDKPCYSKVPLGGSEPLVATISGGTPGGRFQLIFTVPGKASGTAGSQSGNFDALGNAVVTYQGIRPPRTTIEPDKGQTINVSITDYAAGGVEQPAGSFLVSTLTMDVATKPRNPRSKRAVKVSGSPFANQELYGFITKPDSAKVLKKFKIGKANVCGYAERRAVVAPRSNRTGTYRLYINAGSTLQKSNAVWSSFRITRSLF
ncbi:MAG: hypothetical protein JHC95_09315 [Solirubrobacteraceae bacterium]|nr:hypothetical protein [Solirubrobacteraceae bacterium]